MYDVTEIKGLLNQVVRDIILHCAVSAEDGAARQAASDLGLSTHAVNTLAAFWEKFGSRDDLGIEPTFPFLLNPAMFTAIMSAPDPERAHEVAMAEQLNPAQIRQRFPDESRARTKDEPVFETTITEPELHADGTFRAFVDLGDLPPERWPAQAKMTIKEKK